MRPAFLAAILTAVLAAALVNAAAPGAASSPSSGPLTTQSRPATATASAPATVTPEELVKSKTPEMYVGSRMKCTVKIDEVKANTTTGYSLWDVRATVVGIPIVVMTQSTSERAYRVGQTWTVEGRIRSAKMNPKTKFVEVSTDRFYRVN